MLTSRELVRGPISVAEYICTADQHERPVVEQHRSWSISYVRRGSFGCHCRGRRFDLVPGSVLIGRPEDEFMCTHEHHHGGDECLAFFLDPGLVDDLGDARRTWRSGALPPTANVIALGELAGSLLQPTYGPRVDEVGMVLTTKVLEHLAGRPRSRRHSEPSRVDRRRAIESGLWIEAHAAHDIDLAAMARQAGVTVYHYLRLFAAVLGVTPHQYLLRCRLRRAAHLLAQSELTVTDIALEVGFADLSNFVRTFRRASGVTPLAYRTSARGERKIFQARPVSRA